MGSGGGTPHQGPPDREADPVYQRPVPALGYAGWVALALALVLLGGWEAWVRGQGRFHPNWEVAKIVPIPLRELLQSDHYIGLRLRMMSPLAGSRGGAWQTFPAFRHMSPEGPEILWGATATMTRRLLGLPDRAPDGVAPAGRWER